MSDRNVEQELSEFFRRTATPEPSRRLREAVAAGRMEVPLVRPATFRVGRTALSAMGLAATFVIAVSLLLIVVYRHTDVANSRPTTCASSTPIDPSAECWFTPTGSMATARDQATATLLRDGRVLIVGGMGGPPQTGSALASAELYDPATGTFSPTGSLATARMDHTATLLPDGRVLIAGGAQTVDGRPTLASAELYDPATGKFSPTGSMASERVYDTATLLEDGRVLIAGGFAGPMPGLASAELYDPRTGEFSPTGSMTTPRSGNTATLLQDGRVFIAGGTGGAWEATAELYDPKTGSFSSAGSMVSGRYDHTATALPDGRVLISGGFGYGPDFTSTELYDPKTGKFAAATGSTGAMALDRAHGTATLLPDGRVLIAGGHIYGDLATAALYDPVTGAFSSAGSMTAHRSWHTATSLPDGRVLIAGGESYPGSILASAELYQP